MADGKRLVGHAGAVLLRRCADRMGLTGALAGVLPSSAAAGRRERAGVLVHLAIAIALGAANLSEAEQPLAGCSMGGYVAMAFLRRHPGRVRALALLASRATADTHETAAERLRFADLMLDETLHGQVVRRTAPLLLGASTRAQCPDLVEEVLAMAEDAPPETVAWAQRAIAARPDSLSVLRATDVPAVVVTGAEDELVSLQDAARTADALPRGRLVVVPGTGHLQPMEASAQVTSLLTTLLDDAMTADRNR
ncbi:alpha/beta fold hydrolase [Streptomyces sp. NBC_01089]|uniref:alpha/beta fold hydrolase n=1 Tax=Streptomyces sp. NBC_01089 TaxID=2903747 RepID=UPI003863E0C9|nr:alpha/beta hydrolase [Streptomyces sp. NBC_01089]